MATNYLRTCRQVQNCFPQRVAREGGKTKTERKKKLSTLAYLPSQLLDFEAKNIHMAW